MHYRKALLAALFLAAVLFGCGGSGGTYLTGDFLSWTGGADTSHSFTLVRINGQTGTVSDIGGFGFFSGLAYGPDGDLYGV